MALYFAVLFPVLLISIMGFVFWLIMLIDVAQRKFKDGFEKVVWVLIIVFTSLIGALIYYFAVQIRDESKSMKWFWWTLFGLFVLFIFLVFFTFAVGSGTVVAH
jgi:magnesium-transporting ATPase (P-type)